VRTADNTSSGYLQNGNFNFNGQLSGEGMADFLTGQMQSFSQSRAQQTSYRQTLFSTYAQDTIHLSQRLTVNVGLRWEPYFVPQDKFGRGSTFSMPAFLAGQKSVKFPLGPAGSFYYGDPGYRNRSAIIVSLAFRPDWISRMIHMA
jgi:outer membrane receptor for monomeric catechols